ncbi:MAG: hypothetical protein V2I33_18000, partial [Kangiellaceae bacterium]|nr:hypothetical protein [Kangiellaceae bacterium]
IRSTKYDVSLKETGLNTILRQLISSAKCCGMAADQIKSHLTPADVSKIVPLGEQMHASSCSLLATDGGQMCGQCAAFSQVVDARRASADTTLHKNTPLRTASKQQLIDALKTERHSVSKLKKTVKALTKQKKELVSIDDTFHKALTGIMDERNENASEFVKLFWEEQKKMHARTMSGMIDNFLFIYF